jgi:hypothetical protein
MEAAMAVKIGKYHLFQRRQDTGTFWYYWFADEDGMHHFFLRIYSGQICLNNGARQKGGKMPLPFLPDGFRR